MGVPKHKKSYRRVRNRRTRVFYHTLPFPEELYVKCSECGKLKLPHRVCPYCGKYRGVTYINLSRREERRRRKMEERAKTRI
ncbi:MAG: 50S ribosomal protein L32 [Brevinematia bacterium]